MRTIEKTRFIAANYSNLQGLKAVPLGMLLILVVVWANAQSGRASNLTLPILFSVVTILSTWAIYRYYRTHFGKVEIPAQKKNIERIIGVVGGILGLIGFLGDVNYDLPISLVGLMFAGSMIVEYLRMQWYAPGHYLLPLTLFTFGLLLLTSILPLMGVDEWWLWFGFRAQLYGVLVVAGAVISMYGLLGHVFFVRQLPKVKG